MYTSTNRKDLLNRSIIEFFELKIKSAHSENELQSYVKSKLYFQIMVSTELRTNEVINLKYTES